MPDRDVRQRCKGEGKGALLSCLSVSESHCVSPLHTLSHFFL